MPLKQGLIHVYTGEGKGKTTASMGLAFRAAGRGLRVLVMQFFKPEAAGECAWEGPAPQGGGSIHFRRVQLRHTFFSHRVDKPAQIREIAAMLEQIQGEWRQGLWDLVVLDEINIALHDQDVAWPDFARFLDSKPPQVELVCTGRGAPQALQERADYVTEMTPHKHPFDRKITARKGIEY
jgi:cob(I)alamin adenosyltransferase